jgi:hypothetical protein
MRVLTEEGIKVHPVNTVFDCLETVFGVDKGELLPKIKERVGKASSLTRLN